ncbi:hypothetical protein M3568_15590 [Priestia flexa]|uniref:hypothetical protein n=1 Tax=Priestia flexa TaxID=86664 RepID=UPI00203D1A01|nr:hypothetical protein [Priestia flexa]MCM3067795.1 hypothetical protein [Priestia flexa]
MKNPKPSSSQRQLDDYGAKGALNAPSLSLSEMLTYALQDGYLAQARYNNVITTFGPVRTFVQIKEAELRHIDALLPLFDRSTKYRFQMIPLKTLSKLQQTSKPHIQQVFKQKSITSRCMNAF